MGDEIGAMSAIDKAMAQLEDDEQLRVLRWAADKFGGGKIASARAPEGRAGGAGANGVTGTFERISDLMDAASPSRVVDYVLVASYWFQIVQGKTEFTSQEVNAELKDLGHPSSNITDSYNTLIRRKPAAVRQVQKLGSSKQARKRYRLTNEGIRAVERMMAGTHDDES